MTGCKTGKVRFNTVEEALRRLKQISRNPRNKAPVRHYPCEECHGYHLTSQPGHNEKYRPIIMKKEFAKYLHHE